MKDWMLHINNAYQKALEGKSKLPAEVLKMDGMTGSMPRHFYNNLLELPSAKYLEIGTWKGSSLCSAMHGNKARVVAMDDFSGFGSPKQEFLNNVANNIGENEFSFYEHDCFKFDVESFEKLKFNIYLFDGDHSEESQYQAIDKYLPAMEDTFIFVCDDWNWNTVSAGTHRAIMKNNLNVLYSKEIKTESIDAATWWNGMAVFILQKQK